MKKRSNKGSPHQRTELATFAVGILAIVTAWTSSRSWYSTNVCYRKCIATAEHSAMQALTCARPIYSKNMCYQKRIIAILATPEHVLSARQDQHVLPVPKTNTRHQDT